MIPRTFPSSVASNGSAQMIVYFLPFVSGLTRWVDYIPVQYTTASTSTTENTYNQNGYIPVASLSSISGLTPFKEYVPVYLDNSATDVWKVNITGFIPVGVAGVGGIPYALFAAGEQGWIYDPSNLTSLFQDSAGTTPVTAMEQPVGLQLDLSGRGNHRRQATSANRPVVSARVNLLTGTETLATQTVTTLATTQTLTFTGSGSITLSGTATGTYTAGTYSVTTTAGSLIVTVLGTVTQADLRASSMGVGLPSYQRVNTSTDYDSAGFPIYIKANGSNQFMVSNAIDFTATDKMTVWTGVRKLSDAAGAIFAELSAGETTNNGSFYVAAPEGTTADSRYSFKSRGTASSAAGQVAKVSAGAAPDTAVITALGDISGDSNTIRRNGTAFAVATADQGSGNYGNYAVYHYSRAGTLAFFNGHDYGSICRGAASSAAQITAAEDWINQRTKAY